MAYKLEFNRKADREFRRLDRAIQERLAQALEALEGDPRPRGARKLTAPGPPRYRIRVGDYRAVYPRARERGAGIVGRGLPGHC